LLARINQGLPSALRERIACLRARREDESITDVSLAVLMDQLGSHFPEHV
jgi:hypothetical protein